MPSKIKYHKVKVIYNPNAGRGVRLPPFIRAFLGIKHGQERFENIEEYLDKIRISLERNGIFAEYMPSESSEKACQTARECAEKNYDLVIAVGGDGTINAVANGLAESNTVMGVIPSGTVNIFALEFKLPISIERACDLVSSADVQSIDLGRINQSYFCCMAGIGFDAYILKKADGRGLKKVFGAFGYVLAALYHFIPYRFGKIKFKVDDEKEYRKGRFVFICNGRYYGGAMVMAPNAELNDGKLDVCVLEKKNIFSLISYLFSLLTGRLEKHKSFKYFQCKKLSVSSEGKHPIHIDAEYLGKTPAEVQVCPNALKVVVPNLSRPEAPNR